MTEPQLIQPNSHTHFQSTEAALPAAATSSHQIGEQGSNAIRKGSGPLSSSRPSGIRAGQQKSKSSQQSAGAGQKSLKAFFQPPAARASGAASGSVPTSSAPLPIPIAAAVASAPEIAQPSSVSNATSQLAAQQTSPLRSQTSLAATVSNSSAFSGQADVHSASSSQDVLAASQSSQAMSLSQSMPGAEKAAATEAWQRIHTKMKAPKCKGHNEDCVIREVKKNGPNKGEQGKRCQRDTKFLIGLSYKSVLSFSHYAVFDTDGMYCCPIT